MMPRLVSVPTRACTARCTIPSPPTTTSASTPSATAPSARSRASSPSRPTRLRTLRPASLSTGSAQDAVRVPRPLPACGLVSSAISLATRRSLRGGSRRSPCDSPLAWRGQVDERMTMIMQVPTPDGRELEVLLAGAEDGFPIVSHHGTPQGVVPEPVIDAPAAERGLRVISYSRPGYGESSPPPAATATIADDIQDVTAILDHLGLDRFLTIGWSGGGPRSLGCAALLP